MRVVLFNDDGQSIGSFEHEVRSDDRSPAQAFALLDLVEQLLESATRSREEVAPAAPLRAMERTLPNAG
jgi:hypothetical protein